MLWVGKMDFRKQLALALQTMAAIGDNKFRLHIVGGGDAAFYQQMAEGLGIALVLACGLLAGCTVETQEEKADSGSNQYYLYYVNKEETKVVKERYWPEQESAEFMLKDLAGILNAQEGNGENLALLPTGVQLETYRLNESLLELEFSSEYSEISRTREILVRAGVARTFLQIPGITGIKIFIGKEEVFYELDGVGDKCFFAGTAEDSQCIIF